MRSYHQILTDAHTKAATSGRPFMSQLLAEVDDERPAGDSREELETSVVALASDAFAELYPEHVGLGLADVVWKGIPDLGLTGREVSAAIARRAIETCPA